MSNDTKTIKPTKGGKGDALRAWLLVVAALIAAPALSACSSAPADPDRYACEGIATWLADGQPADERADVAARALRDAEDADLIAKIESWGRADKKAVAAGRLDIVAVRCLQLHDERAWGADR